MLPGKKTRFLNKDVLENLEIIVFVEVSVFKDFKCLLDYGF